MPASQKVVVVFPKPLKMFGNPKYIHIYNPLSIIRTTGLKDLTPDLTNEEAAQKWIRNAPEAFCNTHDKEVLSQVLNNYDQETTDFYRWETYLSASRSG